MSHDTQSTLSRNSYICDRGYRVFCMFARPHTYYSLPRYTLTRFDVESLVVICGSIHGVHFGARQCGVV